MDKKSNKNIVEYCRLIEVCQKSVRKSRRSICCTSQRLILDLSQTTMNVYRQITRNRSSFFERFMRCLFFQIAIWRHSS